MKYDAGILMRAAPTYEALLRLCVFDPAVKDVTPDSPTALAVPVGPTSESRASVVHRASLDVLPTAIEPVDKPMKFR